jgi:hypothetical protein
VKIHLTSGACRLGRHSLRTGPAIPPGPSRARRRPALRRRGIASMLAMLYLVLFSALALGYYSATTMSAQVSRNERAMSEAQHAAESGLQFMRYKLSQLSIPSNTKDADVPAQIYGDLVAILEKTNNLAGRSITASGSTVFIPAITLDGNTRFAATVQWANGVGRLTVTGLANNGPNPITRTVQVECTLQTRSGEIFGFGLASQGPVQMKQSSGTKIVGEPNGDASILSAYPGKPAIVTGSGMIEGDLSVVGSTSQVVLGGGSVGGSTYTPDIMENHVKIIPPPEFPTIDTTVFLQFAVNKYTPGKSYYKNIRIPPRTNPTFSGGDVIEGIMYVESPNNVSFRGNAQVNGVIVFDGQGNPTQNTLDFRGSVSPDMPNTSEFAGIRDAAKGLSLLAPTAAVSLGGSNDGTLQGTLIANRVSIGGSANVSFVKGSLVTLGPVPTMIEGGTVSFTGTGLALPPTTGITFSGYLRLSPWTYRELQ